jgi:hypothetical protein
MKLPDTTATIERIGTVSEESQFKMKTSRKAFQILSDLYSDKPLAIVRELGCNAQDSHTAAGYPDRPIEIHIPNGLEPWLTIKDYGTGISHSDIYNIYTVYFESTKAESNDQIGCLGLGSKSPYCYTDNYTITSIFNGEKNIYNAHFNESNTPAIAHMFADITSEPNGVEIQIPIKEEDFYRFTNAIKKAFRFFTVKPIITGGTIDWTDEKPIFEGDNWASYEGFSFGEAYAVMGGVTYPIQPNMVDNKHYQMLSKAGLVLRFEMGELDFVPSREALSYCELTVNSINAKMNYIVSDFATKVSEMIEEKENILEALKAVNYLKNKFSFLNSTLVISDNIMWKGINVSNPIKFITNLCKDGVMSYSFTKNSKKKYRESVHPSIETKAIWMNDDLAKGTIARVKNHLKNNPDDVITMFNSVAYAELIAQGFPADIFKATSTLPKASRQKSINVGGTKRTGFNVYNIGTSYRKAWDGEEFDAANPPKYYIIKPTTGYDFDLDIDGLTRIYEKNQLTTVLNAFGIKDDEIFMVSERNVKHLPSTSIRLEPYIQAKVKVEVKNMVKKLDDIATASRHNLLGEYKKLADSPAFQNLKPRNEFRIAIEKIIEAHNNTKNINITLIRNYYTDISNTKGKAYNPTFTNSLYELMFSMIGQYHWEASKIITILENI